MYSNIMTQTHTNTILKYKLLTVIIMDTILNILEFYYQGKNRKDKFKYSTNTQIQM